MTTLKFDAKIFYDAFESEVDAFVTLCGEEHYILSHDSLNNFMGKIYNLMKIEEEGNDGNCK